MQVPNRYYNSPWIADAARNLSIALVGDPDRDAAREQRAFEMQRAREADVLAAQERDRQAQARRALAQLATATEQDAPAFLSQALELGAPANEAFSAAGVVSPKFRQQSALQDAKLSSALDALNVRLGVQEKLADMRDATTRRGQDITAETAAQNRASRERMAKWRNDIKLHLDKLNRSNPKPINIPAGAMDDIAIEIAQLAKGYEGQLKPEDARAITSRTFDLWKQTGDPYNSALSAFNERMGTPTVEPGTSSSLFGLIGEDKPATLVPGPGAQAVPQARPVGPTPLSNAFIAPTAAPPTAAPVQPQLPVMSSPEEAAMKLRPGQQFMTPDGRVMTRK